MGQNYSHIITKVKIEVPENIPHFVKDEVTTIPIDAESLGVELFIEHFYNGSLNYPYNDNDHIDSCSPQLILRLIRLLKLEFKEFAISHISDWADFDLNCCHAAYRNGNLIKGIMYINDETKVFVSYGYVTLASLKIDSKLAIEFHDYYDALFTFERAKKE